MEIWLALCVIIIAILAAGLVFQRQKGTQELSRAEFERQRSLKAAELEAEKRMSRIRKETELNLERAEHNLLKDLMPLADALIAARGQSGEGLAEGVELVWGQFESILRHHGVEVIQPGTSDEFDPSIHEAVDQRETEESESGMVAECYRVGFSQGSDVLRPAMVAVTKKLEASKNVVLDFSEEEVENKVVSETINAD